MATTARPITDVAGIAAVLKISQFRRLWIVLSLSSVGDWLGLLAASLFASQQFTSTTAQGAAFGGVIVMRLLPALLLGPLAGVFADRFDRRWTMAICDVIRFILFASMPLAAVLVSSRSVVVTWVLIATFLTEVAALFWIPAKEAGMPNLVPRKQLESANQLSLVITYGVAPVVGALLLGGLSRGVLLAAGEEESAVDIALYINALTFLASAFVVFFFVKGLSGRRATDAEKGEMEGTLASLAKGWRFVRGTAMVRGLIYGIMGSFAAGGAVIGVAKFYSASLSGGDAAFALLFASLFIGLGVGMAFGPMVVRALSRRRWFGISIVLAGAAVLGLASAPHLSVALPLAFTVGVGAGMAYLAGVTLLGAEVDDSIRGRVFAFVQSTVRVVLMLAIGLASFLVGLGGSRRVEVGLVDFEVSTSRGLLMIAGVLAVATGVLAFRRMDDKPGVPVLADLWSSLRGRPLTVPGLRTRGIFVAFEGGEGSGKSTQVAHLARWLHEEGYECLATHEPGGTRLGREIRSLLLHRASPSPRAEVLLYAADRAEHVATVIQPALDQGTVVLTDRYIDSSLAYQAAGRELPGPEIAWISEWATTALVPDLVVVIDLPAKVGIARANRRGKPDRLEAESLAFHERVRRGYLERAASDPGRYLVVDGESSIEEIARRIRERVLPLIPTRVRGGTRVDQREMIDTAS